MLARDRVQVSLCAGGAMSNSWSEGTFLSGLSNDQQADLENHTRSYSCPQGTLLFSEGELPQRVLILLEGQVTLSVNSSDGKRLIIGIARAGDVLGLASVLSGIPYEMATESQYACKLSSVDRLEFVNFLVRHTSALQSAALSLSQSYNQACTRFRTLSGSPTGRAKIARLLLEFSASGPQPAAQFRMALNHQEIGEWVGMSRESVTRVLSAFRRGNLITQKGACLAIRDRATLERFAAERRLVRTDKSDRNICDDEAIEDESIGQLIEHAAVLQRHKVSWPGRIKEVIPRRGLQYQS
jgi:CRP/FNR family transcriptional regulator, cyclic AMP receptor protein